MTENELRRFLPKVNMNGPIPTYRPELGPCWIWLAGRSDKGYGTFGRDDGSGGNAHRIAYEHWVHHGRLPRELVVDHQCRVPLCVNPGHLKAMTQKENMAIAIFNYKTHCVNGHPMDDCYIVNRPYSRARDGKVRICRTCQRLKNAANYRRVQALKGKPSKKAYRPMTPLPQAP